MLESYHHDHPELKQNEESSNVSSNKDEDLSSDSDEVDTEREQEEDGDRTPIDSQDGEFPLSYSPEY
jgi:hypothetical protein